MSWSPFAKAKLGVKLKLLPPPFWFETLRSRKTVRRKISDMKDLVILMGG